MTRVEGSPVTLAGVALAHRERWVAARCGERAVVRLEHVADRLAAVRRAVAEDDGAGAITWLDGVPAAGPDDQLREQLATAARRGWGIALAIPGAAIEPPAAPVAAAAEPAAVAAALAAAFDSAEIVPQRLAEASIIAAEPGPLAGDWDDAEPAAADVHAWLVLAGLPAAGADTVALSAGSLHRTYLVALEAANAELRRANVRLARERLGTFDTAAASVVNRVVLAEDAMRRAEEARDAAVERLELEKEVAARNHGYFEAARDQLAEPQHRIAAGIVRRARHVPGARRLGAAVARRALPRG